MNVKERYRPIPVAVNSSVRVSTQSIGGFLATTAGTITITNDAGINLLTAHPVSAGVYLPLPIFLTTQTGGTFTTAGGASGTLLV